MKPGLYVATVRGVEGVHVLFDESGLGQTASLVEGCYSHGDDNITDARPLVVLDPESVEDVRALLTGWLALDDDKPTTYGVKAMQDVLRALADPKPPEPTGLGAVVRDHCGHLFLRDGLTGKQGEAHPWWNEGPHYRQSWVDIDVAEVLSEGWSE